MEDLLWMSENGLEALILKEAAKGKLIFGICGGYQMMGETCRSSWSGSHGTIKGMRTFFQWIPFLLRKRPEPEEGSFQTPDWCVCKSLVILLWKDMRSIWVRLSWKGDAKPSTNIQDSVTGERKADGAYLDNVRELMSMVFSIKRQ